MSGHDRRVVEQAKGVLMLHYGSGSYEALGMMARWSEEAGVAVDNTARALVFGICQGRMSGTSRILRRHRSSTTADRRRGRPPSPPRRPGPRRPRTPA